MNQRQLTNKEAKLIKGIAQGKTKQQAAIDAGYGSSPESAASIGNRTLKKVNVQEALQAELIKQGNDIETIVAPVTKALRAKKIEIHGKGEDAFAEEVEDIELQLKGHDRALRLLGIKNEATTNNFIFVSKEDKNALNL